MINPMTLEGKIIIVTGAASGIGMETARILHALGAKLLLLDVDGDGLETIKGDLGESVSIRVVDLLDSEMIKPILIEERDNLGGYYSGLVHCAGVPSVVPLRGLSCAQYERVMKINTEAGLMLAKAFASRQCHNSSFQGSIVFISSVYGIVGSAANVAYATSKAAVIGMTRSLAIELAGKNIRVNCVAPGFVKTNMAGNVNKMFDAEYADKIEAMHPLGWGEPRDIANSIAFLLSDASKWTTGAVFNVDGGYTAQ